MANKLTIVISAIDDATKTVNKVNRAFANALLPVTRIQRSIGNLGKAIGSNPLAKGLVSVGKAAGNVAERIGKILAPLAAVVSVGSIAGVAALAFEWGKLAMNVSNAAQNIGMSASQLMGLQGTAKLAGVSSEELTSNLTNLGNTLEDARFGRNQGALMLMNRLGIGLHRLKNGSVDTQRAMMDLATVMQRPGIKGNAQVENLIANQFGVSGLLPLLRQGPKAIAAYQAQVRALGGEMSGPAIEAARQFETRLLMLQTAVGGLKNSIGMALIPVLQPLIDQLTAWISKNRELIASKVAEYAQKIADWIKSVDWPKVISEIGSMVDKLGGVKGIAIEIAAIKFAGPIASVLNLIATLVQLTTITIPAAIVALSKLRTASAASSAASSAAKAATAAGAGAEAATAAGAAGAAGTAGLLGTLGTLASLGGLAFGVYEFLDYMRSITPGGHFVSRTDANAHGSTGGGIPLGIRSNNPLNILANGNERAYADPTQGIAAAVSNLERHYRGLSIAQIQDKWTGGARTGNTPQQIANYTKIMSDATGLPANAVPDLNDPTVVSSLMTGMIRAENGQMPYTPEQLDQATAAGMQQSGFAAGHGHPTNHVNVNLNVSAPPGTRVTAEPGSDALGPTKVAYSMPTGVTP